MDKKESRKLKKDAAALSRVLSATIKELDTIMTTQWWA